MTQNAPEMDRHVSDGVSNFLFRQQGNDFGGDLIARNIQVIYLHFSGVKCDTSTLTLPVVVTVKYF